MDLENNVCILSLCHKAVLNFINISFNKKCNFKSRLCQRFHSNTTLSSCSIIYFLHWRDIFLHNLKFWVISNKFISNNRFVRTTFNYNGFVSKITNSQDFVTKRCSLDGRIRYSYPYLYPRFFVEIKNNLWGFKYQVIF